MNMKVLAENYEKEAGERYGVGMIVGGFSFYLTLMIYHHQERGRFLVGNIMVIVSYDGAVHSSTNTKNAVLFLTTPNSPIIISVTIIL